MNVFRFSNPAQKEVHLATLTHLMLENHDDQIAKTALSNAVLLSEGTLVTGELDDMIRKTSRMHWWSTIGVSVFFTPLAAFQLWMGYYVSWANYCSAFATLVYMGCLWALYRIQGRYYSSLKMLEDHQLELPPTAIRHLRPVN